MTKKWLTSIRRIGRIMKGIQRSIPEEKKERGAGISTGNERNRNRVYLLSFNIPRKGTKTMEPLVRTKNVKGIEAALRCIIGIIVIIFGLTSKGLLSWVVVLIGVIFILTGTLGY